MAKKKKGKKAAEPKKPKKGRIDIRIAGFGGQGVILSAIITGKAAAIYEGKDSSVMQSYGPEARGSACSGSIVIDDKRVDFPYVLKPDILIALSQDGYAKYRPMLKKDGILVVEEDLVKLDKNEKATIFKIPATRIAEQIGKKIVTNIVLLGYFTAKTGAISYDAMKSAVLSTVPSKFRNLNDTAFDRGYNYGKEKINGGI